MSGLAPYGGSYPFSTFEASPVSNVAQVMRPNPNPKWQKLTSTWLNGTAYYYDPVHQHIWGLCGFDKNPQFTKPEDVIFRNLVETNGLRISPHVCQPVVYSD